MWHNTHSNFDLTTNIRHNIPKQVSPQNEMDMVQSKYVKPHNQFETRSLCYVDTFLPMVVHPDLMPRGFLLPIGQVLGMLTSLQARKKNYAYRVQSLRFCVVIIVLYKGKGHNLSRTNWVIFICVFIFWGTFLKLFVSFTY